MTPEVTRFPTSRCAAPSLATHRSLGRAIWLCLLVVLSQAGRAIAAADEQIGTERDLQLPVIVGTQEGYYPYSYLDRDGTVKGFAIDLVKAVGREMNINVEVRALANTDLHDALASGRVDMIPFWGETKARRDAFDFSLPILRFETVIVVRTDGPVKSPADLAGRKVGVGQRGTVGELYMLEQQPMGQRIYAPTTEELVRQLDDGGCDAVVMSRLTAVTVIERFKLKNVRILEGVRNYDVRYCSTVRNGDALLLARYNEGLSVLHQNGEFDAIYQKWFNHYNSRSITYGEISSIVAGALALVCAVALVAFLRQRALSRRIAGQAAEIAEQRSLLAALYDKHPLATLVVELPVNGDAKLISLNHEATLLFGLERSSDPRTVPELNLTKELRTYLLEAINRQKSSDQPERWEVQLPGSKRMLEAVTVPLDTHGEARRICILTADITKRRLMDQEIAKSRRLRALGELVGGIAHEFNNLLTPILATSSMLRTAPQPATVSNEELNIIDQAANRAADLTKRLLAFGRKIDDPGRTVRLSEAVTNCEALLKTMVDRRIRWENELPDDLPPVAFNPTDFNQIVFNLVLNARDTLLEKLAKTEDPSWKPRLRVSITSHPANRPRPPRSTASLDGVTGWQCFTVEDNGMGIPPEIIDRIFEPFYTTKDVGKGTGLGLSMVWHQVTDAGGDVEVESKLGEGTVFHIYLPCRETRPPLHASAKPETQHPVPQAENARVLIVEDEPMIVRTVTRMFQHLGCRVSTEADGIAVLRQIASDPRAYNLLLVDLNMPQMSGIDLITRLRGTPYRGSIVVMSGRVSDDDLRILRDLKVDRLLLKPFTTEQFNNTISHLLAPRAS